MREHSWCTGVRRVGVLLALGLAAVVVGCGGGAGTVASQAADGDQYGGAELLVALPWAAAGRGAGTRGVPYLARTVRIIAKDHLGYKFEEVVRLSGSEDHAKVAFARLSASSDATKVCQFATRIFTARGDMDVAAGYAKAQIKRGEYVSVVLSALSDTRWTGAWHDPLEQIQVLPGNQAGRRVAVGGTWLYATNSSGDKVRRSRVWDLGTWQDLALPGGATVLQLAADQDLLYALLSGSPSQVVIFRDGLYQRTVALQQDTLTTIGASGGRFCGYGPRVAGGPGIVVYNADLSTRRTPFACAGVAPAGRGLAVGRSIYLATNTSNAGERQDDAGAVVNQVAQYDFDGVKQWSTTDYEPWAIAVRDTGDRDHIYLQHQGRRLVVLDGTARRPVSGGDVAWAAYLPDGFAVDQQGALYTCLTGALAVLYTGYFRDLPSEVWGVIG